MSDRYGLVRIDKTNAGKAAEVLARAFHEYPLLTHFYPDETLRRRIARQFLATAVYGGLINGEVYATPDHQGVAVWLLPGKYPLSVLTAVLKTPLRVTLGMMNMQFMKMKPVGDFLDERHKELLPGDHLYLQTLGVDPASQGKGLSRKLVMPMLEKAEKDGYPCFVETLKKENVAIYERFGFHLIEESPIPGTPLTNYALLRDSSA